jgi:hypothetical protein
LVSITKIVAARAARQSTRAGWTALTPTLLPLVNQVFIWTQSIVKLAMRQSHSQSLVYPQNSTLPAIPQLTLMLPIYVPSAAQFNLAGSHVLLLLKLFLVK